MTTRTTLDEHARKIGSALAVWPQHDDREIDNLRRVTESGSWWRVQGSEVDQFEVEFARFTGFDNSLTTTNGTHAIELALQVMGVGRGDEVILPAFTFVSTGMAVARLGATPVFAEVDRQDYCMLPEEVERLAGPKTKAVLPVHMAGVPADLDAIERAAAGLGIPVLQDAAHAQGTELDGRPLGSFGSPAIYSFQNGKLMTSGEGGAVGLTGEDDRDAYFVHHNCGRRPEDRVYEHGVASSNFRMSEFQGAVLRAQLERLGDQVDTRERNITVFTDRLAIDGGGLRIQARPERATRVTHYMVMLEVEGDDAPAIRHELVEWLRTVDIPIFHNYRPIQQTKALAEFARAGSELPDSDEICRNGFWLHHRVLLSDPDVVDDLAGLLGAAVASLRADR